MKVVEAYDDVDWARDRTKTIAAHTITVAYNGAVVELDVGQVNYDAIDAHMTELLRAGRKITSLSPERPVTRERSRSEARAFYRNMKRWADDNRIMRDDDPSVPAYMTPGGNVSWPKALIRQYEAYLRGMNGTETPEPAGQAEVPVAQHGWRDGNGGFHR